MTPQDEGNSWLHLGSTLVHCTVAHNVADGGGGIYNQGGQLTANKCTFTGNTALNEGGAIRGSCTVNGSTIHNNVALRSGGGIFGVANINNSTITENFAHFGGGLRTISGSITNSTVSGNRAYIRGGGLLAYFAGSAWVNSIFAGNSAPSNSNLGGPLPPVISNSLTNGNPLLAPLGDYGGFTLTMPPLANSPALDAGANSVTNLLATDQRGYPRLSGAHVDIGAVESQGVNATSAPVLKLTFTNSPDIDFTVIATTNIALPQAQWSVLGAARDNPSGQYQFTDIFAPDHPQRFYRVTSP